MHVAPVELPPESSLHRYFAQGDFLDCYAGTSDTAARPAAETIANFPWWGRGLVWVRKLITLPFGLKQSGAVSDDMLGPFPVIHQCESEVVAGFDDAHLNFRISVLQQNGRLHLATWVRPHNWLGRTYLALIMPFHILIAKNGVKRAAQIR